MKAPPNHPPPPQYQGPLGAGGSRILYASLDYHQYPYQSAGLPFQSVTSLERLHQTRDGQLLLLSIKMILHRPSLPCTVITSRLSLRFATPLPSPLPLTHSPYPYLCLSESVVTCTRISRHYSRYSSIGFRVGWCKHHSPLTISPR